MSFAPSACSFGSRGVLGRTSAVLFLLSLAWQNPGSASAQTATTFPPLSFRQHLELEVLGDMSGDFAHAPSLRLTLQRRHTLLRSTILSGMLLMDPLSNSEGLAVGQMLTFGSNERLLEPFAELGVAYADARVPDGSYTVAGSGGAGPRVVQRYQIAQGPAALAGAGVSWSGMVHDRTPVRLTLGYWQLAGAEGFRHGSLRFGVSLGIARRDARWYALATDRTPPEALVMGRAAAISDSVEVADGRLRVLAADANGIERIEVNGGSVSFGSAGGASARLLEGDRNAVVGAMELRPPFGGEMLDVAVRDSAGLLTRSTVWAFPPPDHEPPVVSVLAPATYADTLTPAFRAQAEDPSGIADARIGVCPVRLVQAPPDTADLGAMSVTARLVDGWGAAGQGLSLEVRDRAGNVARTSLPPFSPDVPQDAPPPQVTDLTATAGSRVADGMSVRVRGTALDPAGGWIAGVEVEGRPAVLRIGRSPSHVQFDGWLVVDPEATSVRVTGRTLDGRTVQESVPIKAGGSAHDSERSGRMSVLLVLPDATADRAGELRDLARKAGADDARVLVGRDATPASVRNTLTQLQLRAGPEDVVLLRLEGALAAEQSATSPSVELASGRRLDLTQLGHLVRAMDVGVTLVSAGFRPGRSWQASPITTPGVRPPAGCYQHAEYPAGAVVDAGTSAPERILTGLGGDADADGDGRVLMKELLAYIDASPGSGLLAFDPLLTVSMPGGTR